VRGLAWVVWRQQRAALPVTLVLIAILVRIEVPDSTSIDVIQQYGVAPSQAAEFVVLALGLFWAAPLLAREQQTGTIELAYTQSISRARWLTARIAPPLLAAVVAPLVVAGLQTSYYHPPHAGGFLESYFSRSPAFVGIELFSVALGLLAGAVLRRTVPAMVVTALGFYAAENLYVQPWGQQWLWFGLLVAVAAALVGATYYWMTRRVPRS
jgi:ABC-type transport system involved in multi-copper enzyme maturation permease subunit